MSLIGRLLKNGPSGFGYNSTAEDVTAGLDLTGKTILVTGCNSGLGQETARVLALRGAHVLGTARTIEKARDAERLGADQAAALNKAMMHAIDVETINAQLFSNTLSPSNNFLSHVPGYEENPEGFVTYEYDPAKAQAILQESGFDTSQPLQWLVIGTPGTRDDAMQAMLAAVGITAEYSVVDAATAIAWQSKSLPNLRKFLPTITITST